ncbi:glycosyltransferase family 4 protein [Photobacterium sp. CCB-ST2H9]|uniref:glycosyltransferase family 4 protein n=1 Tax=Photobacterium sp. CCB-ST2H9 TaxID=2912855 RepID=UPI0020048364|nr:glycosyltransferase family 4 protein [Photobacterium sp. CCB-ST2H9]UTM56554.1 glycosyltransferase family 4 protein [Photobacterium sp. CCB-ST2H9]
MKAIFAHDHRFLLDRNGFAYSKGKIKKESFDLYLSYFDSVSVISRYDVENDSSTLKSMEAINDIDYIDFIPFKNLSTPKELLNCNNLELMCEKIKGHDFLIARLPSEIGLLAIKAARKLKIKYTIEFVACPWDALWNYGGIRSKLYAPFYYVRNRMATTHANSVSYVTSSFLQRRYPSNGIKVGVSDVVIDTESNYRVKRVLDRNKVINIGLIGSLDSPHKGIGDAIKAVGILLEKGCKINLNLLGPGDISIWKKQCESFSDYVNFCGIRNPGKDVQEWLARQDIYIQPSLQEGLPRAIIEAMNCGLPIIGSNAGGIPELVNQKFIHPKKDYIRLSDLILYILTEENEYEAMSEYSLRISERYVKNNLDKVRNEFWDSILKV